MTTKKPKAVKRKIKKIDLTTENLPKKTLRILGLIMVIPFLLCVAYVLIATSLGWNIEVLNLVAASCASALLGVCIHDFTSK